VNQSKPCTKCKETKPVDCFSTRVASKDNLSPRCKLCSSAYDAVYYAAHSERIIARTHAYEKSNTEKIANTKRAYQKKHKARLNAISRSRYEANKASATVYSSAYKKAHPEVAAKSNHKRRTLKSENGVFAVSSKELRRIRELDCAHCGAVGPSHIDHVIPLAKGGRHSIGNLQPLCQVCNGSKQDSFYMVFKVRHSQVMR